uniref:Uncharacterized protein n=1 Tax=Oryza nivara TaxID=4536 RepID=A0A0E0HSI0_ORYNI
MVRTSSPTAWRAWRWRARRIWAQARHIWRRGPQRRWFLSSSLLRERRWRGAAVEEDLATGRGDARGFGSANASTGNYEGSLLSLYSPARDQQSMLTWHIDRN